MPDPTLTNPASGTATTSSVTATFGFTATAERLLVLSVVSDDYAASVPSGYTASANCSQESWHGHYVWWKVAAGGETSVGYAINSAARSSWVVAEFDNIDATPLDDSDGAITQPQVGLNRTSSNSTPTTGRRLVLAALAFSKNGSTVSAVTGWTNSFVEAVEGPDNTHKVALAYRVVTGDGSTTFNTNAAFSSSSSDADCGSDIVIAFRAAAGGGNAPRAMHHYRRRRAA